MAAILPQPINRSKTKLHNVKVDMTPMVDLGFLLITFFIFTTTMAEPTITKLSMPTDAETHMTVEEKKLLTLLVEKGRVWLYTGSWEKAKAANRIVESNYHYKDGVGKWIREKQLALKNERDDLMVAIKPTSTASFQDVMNALDEMHLNDVKRYGIIKITDAEKDYLSSYK